ncbi:TIGR03915 family putative DNA repair protein [Eggerthellaceae bacterium 24-137]
MAFSKAATAPGHPPALDIYDEVAYAYDGSLEGLLTAIFASYERHEKPTDMAPAARLQPRLGQRVAHIETDPIKAERVLRGIKRACGWSATLAVKRAACADDADAGTAVFRFVRYAMDEQKRRNCEHCRKRGNCKGRGGMGPCPKQRGRAFSDITHPAVEQLFRIARAVSQECEHIRQFARFQHLRGEGTDLWFARVNPKGSVVPLIMAHFVERMNDAPFIIYDEAHELAGVYDGGDWYLVNTSGNGDLQCALPRSSADEALYAEAWRAFYRSVSVDARYNPELRRQFMPKRFWKNLTELQETSAALRTKD